MSFVPVAMVTGLPLPHHFFCIEKENLTIWFYLEISLCFFLPAPPLPFEIEFLNYLIDVRSANVKKVLYIVLKEVVVVVVVVS